MQCIDYDVIARNATEIRKLSGVPLIAVVKSNAYGHGLAETARSLCGIADYFAVSDVSEALNVCSLNTPTMILLPCLTISELHAASTSDFWVTVCDERSLALAAQSNLPLNLQIKIDSGMSRLGFSLEQLAQVLPTILSRKTLNVCGIFSHFRGTSRLECAEQYDEFARAGELAEHALNKRLLKHIAATYAALNYPEFRLDSVRVGLGLYGYGADFLQPAKTVSAKIIATRKVAAGQPVGYDGVFRPQRNTNLAVIDVGYAKGLSRALVGGNILVGGKSATIRAVCMGMTICDTGERSATVGEEVVLLGKGVNPSNCNTIVYELLCNLR